MAINFAPLQTINKFRTGLRNFLWQQDIARGTYAKRLLIRSCQILIAVIRDLVQGQLSLRAMSLVDEGGSLVSASCSYNIRDDLFLRLLARAARDAGRRVWLEERRGASPDHSVLLGLPESAYLKCAFLRVE